MIVEAGYRSGASLTANLAKKQGKHVFAVPCNIYNKKIRTNELIKEGAKLVINPEEIIQDCNIIPNEIIEKNTKLNKHINVNYEYKEIYEVLKEKPMSINEICEKLNSSINNVNSKLVLMEIEGLIENLPGNIYKLV